MNKISTDKKYRYRKGGRATILTTDRPNNGSLTVLSMDENGIVIYHDACGCNAAHTGNDLIEVGTVMFDHIERGDVVEVRDDEYDTWKLRRFSNVDSGLAVTYDEIGAGYNRWRECRLVCAQDNEEWKLA